MLQGLLQSELADDALVTNVRVLHILKSLHSGKGAERLALDTARALVEAKHESVVCSSGGDLVKEFEANGSSHICILDLNTRNPIKIFLNGFVLAEIISEYKIDLVHVYSTVPAWSLFFARKLIAVPIVSVFYKVYKSSGFLKRLYNAVLLKFDMAILPCKAVAKYIEEAYGASMLEKTTIIEKGVDLGEYNVNGLTQNRIEAARNFLGEKYKKKKKTIIVPGCFEADSGCDYFFELIDYMPIEKFQFVILLNKSDNKSHAVNIKAKIARHRAGEAVMLVEEYQDMPAIYHLADMVIDVSKQTDDFGLHIAEAQAMECLTAVNRASDAAAMVCNNETGFLLPKNNPKQAADIVKEVFAMHAVRQKKIKQKAKDKVKDDYDNSKQSKKVIDLYLSML
jgi:glycosyltransferase involved in cell wall biosynthesis